MYIFPPPMQYKLQNGYAKKVCIIFKFFILIYLIYKCPLIIIGRLAAQVWIWSEIIYFLKQNWASKNIISSISWKLFKWNLSKTSAPSLNRWSSFILHSVHYGLRCNWNISINWWNPSILMLSLCHRRSGGGLDF